MSVSDPRADPSADRHDPPTFDLDYRFDDPDDPTEVTVFSGQDDADIMTEWITVDATDALPVPETR
jgi:hypothetical protein